MEKRLGPRITRDWLNTLMIGGLTVGYIFFSLLFLFRPEMGWGRILFFVGGGYLIAAQWIGQLGYLALRPGVLEDAFLLPIMPTKHRKIDLRTVTAATLDTRSMLYVEYGHRLPALVLRRLPGTYSIDRQKEDIELPLPRGRTIDEEEVRAFVAELNREIQRVQAERA